MLEGRRFYVLTDHKPLTFALHRISDAWSARQQRQLSYIAEFTSEVRHVAGVDNVVADALSRPAAAIAMPAAAIAAPTAQPIDFSVLARGQAECADTQQLAREGSLQVKNVAVAGVQLLCDVSAGVLRPLVPVQQRRAVFEALHSLSHPGIRAARRIVTARFVAARQILRAGAKSAWDVPEGRPTCTASPRWRRYQFLTRDSSTCT
jgi:hypothetical protein